MVKVSQRKDKNGWINTTIHHGTYGHLQLEIKADFKTRDELVAHLRRHAAYVTDRNNFRFNLADGLAYAEMANEIERGQAW